MGDNSTRGEADPLAFLAGGGEMGARIRAFDWSKTPVGAAAGWPQSLRTAVRIMLDARYPMFVWWGPALTKFYNDPYAAVLGRRHPAALGRPAAEVWADIWHVVGPQAAAALTEGRATWSEEQLLVMERNGFPEETYFTYSYSPVHDDDGGIRGVFCACTEDTARVLGQRRLRALRALADQTAQAKTVGGACEAAAATLAENPNDLPFALLYLLDETGRRAALAGRTGAHAPAGPGVVDLADGSAPWPFNEVVETGKTVEVEGLSAGPGPRPDRAVVVPLARPGMNRPAGFVVAGVSPMLVFNDDYKGFLDLLAGHVAAAVANARAHEEERRAEEALRESERRLASELEATTRLHALSTRLLAATDLATALSDVLDHAVETCGADFGNIQLLNPQTGALEFVAQRGFREDFLDHFRTPGGEDGSVCARAVRGEGRVMIEDVELDPAFEPHRRAAAAAGFRAVQSTPLRAHDGALVGVLSTHFRAPHRVSDRDQRLLDLYARHAADLIERLRFQRAMQEADRRKDEFLATLAHELRNPLAPLRNGLEVMKLAGSNGEPAANARAMMERQLTQMVRLVDDLLDLSRVSRGKIELRKERAELAKVVRHAVETSRPLIEASGHALTVTVPPGPVYVDADVTRLAQVFSNLLNNAAKYTERGGRVGLAVRREGGAAVVSVADTGVGIPAPMLPRVFEMFTQVDRTLERSQGGLGIGLSIVKRLVEMHGGTVEARSAGHGTGSEFVVRLPTVAPAAPDPGPGDDGAPRPGRRRILVVDDNRDAATSLATMLTLMGNETRTAFDGLEALDVAAAYRPDVILLDIGMPRLSGHDTARRIREQPWGRGVVLVALTGWGQEEDRRRSREAGIDHHVTKPVAPARLEKLLAELRAGAG